MDTSNLWENVWTLVGVCMDTSNQLTTFALQC